ncbi:MAG TPA: carbamoyltransferase HypF [Methanocorpusculum sp.]|nr:carbamoyltransferase HypF [Methanocorpusculum sp.]
MKSGRIVIRGIVQGVGFRPFVYAAAKRCEICGSVINHGSEVEIFATGARFDEFVEAVSKGPKMSVIDSVTVDCVPENWASPSDFTILPSKDGARSGFIPADIATCEYCLADVMNPKSRYFGYWATSCTDCGPRYSVIHAVPYDRERTAMNEFPKCAACEADYTNPLDRRHHAQTIACEHCGPQLSLLKGDGTDCGIPQANIIKKAAELLDAGKILAIRGVGGFHICCIESAAKRLKDQLGRPNQSLAVMMQPETLKDFVVEPSEKEWELLKGPVHPITILDKLDPDSHFELSQLHNLGVMLPYTALHHLLFSVLKSPLLVMTSANVPGTPMITSTEVIIEKMAGTVDYILTHNREIVNRCDDSVVRDGYLIRLSRGFAPLRTKFDLGARQILAVGPELNANATIYKDGFLITSPHVGNVRNPPTVAYLKETIDKLVCLTGAKPEIIAHDLHPQFLSTRLAHEMAEESGAQLVAVQHHRAHIASVTCDEVAGIAIDGVGYGDDKTIWGGEILCGSPALGYERSGHLEAVVMPGGDLAGKFPERMLYGILPDEETRALLFERGWDEGSLKILSQMTAKRFNSPLTSSTGRVLDAAAALLGICREKTYDGEPSMILEAYAARGVAQPMEICIDSSGEADVLMTSALLREAREMVADGLQIADIAASVQTTLSRGIAELAVLSCGRRGLKSAALSGGVAINRSIRETIIETLKSSGIDCILNQRYPFGDGCISCGQAVIAAHQAGRM